MFKYLTFVKRIKLKNMKTFLTAILLFATTCLSFAQTNHNNHKVKYGRNIISFMPVYAITNNYVGIGGSYEILANDYIGIRVPVMAAINTNYVNVGLEMKLYPARNTGPAKYAIAPMITYGTGSERMNEYVWDNQLNQYVYDNSKYDRSHFGFLLNQTFNFTIMQNFFIGMDGGLGINYYDNTRWNNNGPNNHQSNNNNSNITFLAQFHVMMGCRF
jgi:hypothetical protein